VERLSILRSFDNQEAERSVVTLPVSPLGRIDVGASALGHSARLIAIQAANRETGIRQPIPEIAAARPEGSPLLVDATAIRCHADLPTVWDCIVLDPTMWGGPSGVAIVACRSRIPWRSIPPSTAVDRFSGRVPVPLVAATAMTLPDSAAHADESIRIGALARWFADTVSSAVGHVQVLGAPGGLAHILSLSFLYVNAEQLVDDLARQGFALHSGSACTSDTRRPSHVLTALGALTHGNLRVSLPPGCPFDEVEELAAKLSALVHQQRVEAGVQ